MKEENQEDEKIEDEDSEEELENIIDEDETPVFFRRSQNIQHTLDAEPILNLETGLQRVRVRENEEQEENISSYARLQGTYSEKNAYEENNDDKVYETSSRTETGTSGLGAINRDSPAFQRDINMRGSETNYPGMGKTNENYTPRFQQDSGALPFEEKKRDSRLRDI